jgi:hypothetical protein
MQDTRLDAARWIDRTLPAGSVLALTEILEYSPPVDHDRFGTMQLDHDGMRTRLLGPSDPPHPDYLILTSMNYQRAMRDPEKFAGNLSIYCRIWNGEAPWVPIGRFSTSYLHQDFYTSLDPMYLSYYVGPTIEIYEYRPRVEPNASAPCNSRPS